MEGRKKKLAAMTILALVAMIANVGNGQVCNMSQQGFNACKPAVTAVPKPSSPPSPTKECCEAVAGANLNCLCTFASNAFVITQYKIDKNAALSLPLVCNVDPNFHC